MAQRSEELIEGDNVVLLRGRLTQDPQARELPSGTPIVALRVSVSRACTAMTKGSAQTVDWMDCSVWTALLRKRVAKWRRGDVVEIHGALRRRHVSAAGVSRSLVEVEVLAASRLSEAAQVDAKQSTRVASK